LVAVTVHHPEPVPVVPTDKLPLVPEAEPTAVPAQDTEAEVAFDVFHVNVEAEPEVTVDGEKLAAVTDGAATVVRDAERVEVVPAALDAVTWQVPEPTPDVVTVIEPFRPEPEPAATPEHETDADVAFDVVHEKVVELPAVSVVLAKDAVAAEGAATTDRLAERVAAVPAELYAVTWQVPVPTPEVATLNEPLVPEPEPEATPEQATEALDAPVVAHVKVEPLPAVTVVGENTALETVAAATPVPCRAIEVEPLVPL